MWYVEFIYNSIDKNVQVVLNVMMIEKSNQSMSYFAIILAHRTHTTARAQSKSHQC